MGLLSQLDMQNINSGARATPKRHQPTPTDEQYDRESKRKEKKNRENNEIKEGEREKCIFKKTNTHNITRTKWINTN